MINVSVITDIVAAINIIKDVLLDGSSCFFIICINYKYKKKNK